MGKYRVGEKKDSITGNPLAGLRQSLPTSVYFLPFGRLCRRLRLPDTATEIFRQTLPKNISARLGLSLGLGLGLRLGLALGLT